MSDVKKCPFCSETINTEAVKCRFCRSDLNTPPVASAAVVTQKKRKASLMATIGSLFGLLGVLLFSPLGLVSITMGIMALSQMDPEEKQKSVWRDGTKCRAVAAIVSGLIAIAVWIYSIIRILSH